MRILFSLSQDLWRRLAKISSTEQNAPTSQVDGRVPGETHSRLPTHCLTGMSTEGQEGADPARHGRCRHTSPNLDGLGLDVGDALDRAQDVNYPVLATGCSRNLPPYLFGPGPSVRNLFGAQTEG